MMRICVLGSGSRGNAALVMTATTKFLVDVGLSGSDLVKRLESIGICFSQIDGILITHEHTDHVRGLQALGKMRDDVPVYLNRETDDALGDVMQSFNRRYIFQSNRKFHVGDLDVEPFPVYHDARDPLGFAFHKEGVKTVMVTDIGAPSTLVKERLKDADLIVLEANHDRDMLENGPRPRSLKKRIKGRFGHLSNSEAGELLCEVASPKLRHVVLAHMSMECNRPEIAQETVETLLRQQGIDWVRTYRSYQDKVTEVIELTRDVGVLTEDSGGVVQKQLEIF